MDIPPGFWGRDAAHNPLPRTPLSQSVFDENPAMVAACEAFGFLVTVKAATIRGWHYGGIDWVGDGPEWLVPLLIRVLPAPRRRIRACRKALRTDLTGRVIERWNTSQRDELSRRIDRLLDAGMSTMDDERLARHLLEVREFCMDALKIHFMVIFASMLAVGELVTACRRLLGWEQDRVTELLAGLSTMSTEPARALSTVADGAGLERYHRAYGHRALAIDLADPTLAEVPELIVRLRREQLDGDFDPRHDQDTLASRRKEAADRARAVLSGDDLATFERALERAALGYPLREDNVFFAVDTPLALARYAALAAGTRLAERGRLDTVDDVFFCEWDEVVDAVRTGWDLRPVARRRRVEHEAALANPGPPHYGTPPRGPMPLHRLPADVRASTETLLWMAEQVLAPEMSVRPAPEDTRTLTGVAASPGRYQGTVRVIESEAQFSTLQPGDVLVCKGTRSSWSVLFPLVGAVVADSGGVLSHAAIIAREYRIPAVVATSVATNVLRDGQSVIVDGTAGVVHTTP